MKDCIFCKIVKGEIPSSNLYEDDKVISFLDIMPANKGHCLVVPKVHYETLLDLPEDELCEVMKAVKKISHALSLSMGNSGFNILMNNQRVAGQLVPHVHIHIIPRFKKDRIRLSWSHKKYDNNEMEKFKENIKKFL